VWLTCVGLKHSLCLFTLVAHAAVLSLGWDEGVLKMSLGEKAILHITSDYGYGSQGAGGVIVRSHPVCYRHK
jgi:hypothetical protein